MAIELTVPDVGESIQEVQIGQWLKQEGDSVAEDEDLVQLETDKASMELPAPVSGKLTQIVKKEGESVAIGDIIGYLDDGQDTERAETKQEETDRMEKKRAQARPEEKGAVEERPEGEEQPAIEGQTEKAERQAPDHLSTEPPPGAEPSIAATPSARRALREHGLTAQEVEAQGRPLRASDVARHLEAQREQRRDREPPPTESAAQEQAPQDAEQIRPGKEPAEEVVPMSLVRRRTGERLVAAQQKAALLTTFNEIDMSAVVGLRGRYREQFRSKHDVDLGLMPFFVSAVVDALQMLPELNAEVRDDKNIVFRPYCHVGIAIGTGKGLVVPVLRNAEQLSFAEIEKKIRDFADRAEHNKLGPGELEGGTFTISNGGIYGSLLSTPIVNPPQSGILGMHAIQKRPVAVDDQVVIRPMMYVALTYDHRIVDGREAVTFLKRVKQAVEEPARMLLDV